MVRIGEHFRSDKITLSAKQGPPKFETKTFSKGSFTLLDLGPPSWKSLDSSYQHYVKVRDCKGTRGWIDIKDFFSYRRGSYFDENQVTRRWCSLEELEEARTIRNERIEAFRIEKEKEKEQEKAKGKEKENQKEAPSSAQRSLLAHLKPKDRTASGGSANRDSGIGSSSSKLSERGSRLISDLDPNSKPRPKPRTSISSTNTASSSTSTPQSTKRKAEEIEEEHLKEVQRIRDEHDKERRKIRREQDREVKHLKLKHNVKVQEANLEEAKKELEDFEAEK